MNGHLHETIAELETELESHYQASSDIERTLRYLRARAGAALDLTLGLGAAPPRKGTRASSKRTDGRTDGRTEQKARHTRGRSLPDDKQSEIVLGLLKKHGPLKPRELAEKLGVDAYKVSRVTGPMLKARLIQAAGKTNTRTFHLPGHPPVKEEP